MMFVVYWLLLAFGGLVTVLGLILTAMGLYRKRERRRYVSLGVASLFVAWLPTVAFFAFLYFVLGARPADG